MLAALFIVAFMALERLFALIWPYVYLRVVTKGRTLKACVAIIVSRIVYFSHLYEY